MTGTDNPVWEELSPMIWRNAIYSEESSQNCMGQLFEHEIHLFEDIARNMKAEEQKNCAIDEVGMGTAELFAHVHPQYDMVVGVELSQQMIDTAFELH